MILNNIFKDYVNLFSPYSNEFLYDYICLLGFTDKSSNDLKARDKVLSVLEQLFKLDVIYIYRWYNNPLRKVS